MILLYISVFVGEKVSAEVEVISYRRSVMVCSAVCKAVDRNEVSLLNIIDD